MTPPKTRAGKKEIFKRGWTEACGWIWGDIDMSIPEGKTKNLIEAIFAKWIPEWENSVYLTKNP